MIGMPDREKVIKKLESLRDICNAKSDMAVGDGRIAWAGYANAAADALALLKEQEAKTVLHREERSVIPVKALSGFCPKCSHTLIYGMNKHFCGNCGQEVKWE